MQRQSMRICTAFAVIVLVGVIIRLTKDNLTPIFAKPSDYVAKSRSIKTPSHPAKRVAPKTSHISKGTKAFSVPTKPLMAQTSSGSLDTIWFDDALPAGAVPNTSNAQTQLTAGFKNAEGFYITAVNGGGWEVNLNPSGTRGVNESFRLIDVNGGTLESGDSIRLLAANGTHYLSAHGGGAGWCDQPNGQIFANANQPGAWETFVIRKANGSTGTIGTNTPVTMVSSGNYYFWTEPWDGDGAPSASPNGQLYANRTTIGDWQKFTLEVVAVNGSNAPSKVAFRSSGGFYINAEKGSGWEVNVNRTVRDTEQTFDVVDLNGGQVESGDQIRFHKTGTCGGGYYLSIYGGGVAQGTPPPNGRAYMRSGTPSTNETFTINKADGSLGVIGQGTQISLRTENGFYFTAEGGGQATGYMPPYGRLYANHYVDYYGAVDERVTFTFDLATTSGGGSDELWNWVSSNPAPYSGTKAHQSSIATGLRQHYFTDAGATLSVGIGDHLYTWVYLDPSNMPSEIMLQWNDRTNFEHRAYWGANNINLGTDGTASRKYLGGLPAGGSWVKLDVPASAVGLEGKTLNGMAFTQWGGRVTWDRTGKSTDPNNTRAIVKLDVPFTIETQLPSDAAIQAQRNSITQAQNSILGSLSGYNPKSVKRFTAVPYMALSVNSSGLQQLQSSQYVSNISEDKLSAPAIPDNLSTIGASAAWNLNYTGAGQTIVIIDTGVDKTHPSFTGITNKVVAEACVSTTSIESGLTSICPNAVVNEGGPVDGQYISDAVGSGVNCTLPDGGTTCDNGTRIAGIAAGKLVVDQNGVTQSGVAKDANIISIQVASRLDREDMCQGCAFSYQSDQITALEEVFKGLKDKYKSYNIAAINLIRTSETTYDGNCESGPFKAIIQSLREAGIPTITASGDNNLTKAITEPACVSSAISVGATGNGTDNNSVWSDSTVGSNSISFLNLLAPGHSISAPIPGTTYAPSTGTSYAAAQVSGAWAILRQAQPKPTNAAPEKESALLKTLVSQDLTKFRNNGVLITDTRAGANNLQVPRIQIDAALSCYPVYYPSDTWVGEYYDGTNFTGKLVMRRSDDTDQFLDKDLNDGSITSSCGPGAKGAGEGISISWTRVVSLPTANTYGFSVTADKDVRFYIDGIEKTNGWETIAGTKTYIVNNLPSGNHVLKLEYRTPQAAETHVKLSWSSAPTAPANLAANAISSSQIRLDWHNISSSDGIRIERASGGGSYAVITTVGGNDTSYTDSGLPPVTTYSYRVRAFNSIGETGYSNISTATTLRPVPAAPVNLATGAISPSQINLSWNNNSSYTDGFRIYRNGVKVGDVGVGQTSYSDSGLSPVTTYNYQVTAYNTTGESGYSNQSSAMTWRPIPAAPVNLAASTVSTSQINLSWNNNSSYTDGFRVYRNGGRITDVGAGQTSYADAGLASSTTYTYQVTAYNTTGESGYSNSVSNATQACTDSLDSTSASIGIWGGSDLAVTIYTPSSCSWYVSGIPDWIHVYPSYGTGNRTINITVDSNTLDVNRRSASLYIGGSSYSICQNGTQEECSSYSMLPSRAKVGTVKAQNQK